MLGLAFPSTWVWQSEECWWLHASIAWCLQSSCSQQGLFWERVLPAAASQWIIPDWVCKFFPPSLLLPVPFLEVINGLAFTPSQFLRHSGGISSSTSIGAPAVLLMACSFELHVIEGLGVQWELRLIPVMTWCGAKLETKLQWAAAPSHFVG